MAAETSDKNCILLAVDESEFSCRAFDFCAENLVAEGRELILLHCPELSNVHLRTSHGAPPPYDTWLHLQQRQEAAITALRDKYMAKVEERKLNGRWMAVHSASPGETIVEKARAEGVRAVVTGSRGMGTIRRTLLGSVSDYVVHHASCPVVVVKGDHV